MVSFEYLAIDSQGIKKSGITEADSEKAARQRLRDMGLIPVNIEGINESVEKKQKKAKTSHLSNRELSLLTRQISVLLKSGLPLAEVLNLLISQAENKKQQKILVSLRDNVLEGKSLADAIALTGSSFPPLYQATVAAGESSGKLAEVFESLAEYFEDKANIHQKIKLSLIYPVLLTLVSLTVVISLLVFVIPEIVTVFDSTGQDLPALTELLIVISDFLQSQGQWLLLAVIVLGISIKQLLKNEAIRFTYHRFMLTLPLLGKISRVSNTAKFTRTLAILSRSEVDILRSLTIASKVIANLPMRASVEQAAKLVREGSSFSHALMSSGHFPQLTTQLISSGESSGNLSEMLESTASYHESEIQTLSSTIVGIFEPVLILAMGGIVLTIVIAILLPIFEMNQLVG